MYDNTDKFFIRKYLIEFLEGKFNKNKEYSKNEIINCIMDVGISKEQIINKDNAIIVKNYYLSRKACIDLVESNNIENKYYITNIQQLVKEIPLCDINNNR